MPVKKICLITPGHLSSDPRLLKEAEALHNAGYKLVLIFTRYLDYLTLEDQKIIDKNADWEFIYTDWLINTDKHKRYISGLKRHLASIMHQLVPSFYFKKIILNRYYSWQKSKAIVSKADLYIAHNPGAIAVAADAAVKNKVLFAFDAEDYHRGEGTDAKTLAIVEAVEDYYLPKAAYITAGSPLIAKAYERILGLQEVHPILNVFPKVTFKQQEDKTDSLKLFWFSQTIGKHRGIEEVINAFKLLHHEKLELHLLGALAYDMKRFFVKLMKEKSSSQNHQLIFHEPVSPDKLLAYTRKFDVGLAIEKNEPYNHDICLGNKLFTYLQAGLAMLVSETSAQKQFLETYPKIGKSVSLNKATSVADAIKCYIYDYKLLSQSKLYNYQIGQEVLNWEKEQQKLIRIIKNIA